MDTCRYWKEARVQGEGGTVVNVRIMAEIVIDVSDGRKRVEEQA